MKRYPLNQAQTSVHFLKYLCRKPANIIFTSLLIMAAFSAKAVTYRTTKDGPWNVASTWTCSCIPPTNTSDTINIDHSVTFNGNYSHASTSHLYINNGGSLSISGTYSNLWSNSMLRIASGGAMSASSITFTGNASPVYRIDGLLRSTSASGDISFLGDRQVNFGPTADVTSARDILVGTTNSSAIHIFNGRFSGRNFYHYQSSTIIGNPTFNLTGEMYFYGNAKFYPSSINATMAGNFRIDQSARLDIGPGVVNIGGNYHSIGGAFIEIDADINVSGNWLLGNGPTARFNGDISIDGYFDKFGGAKMYINGDMIVDGSMTVRSGTDSDDVTIASGSYVSASSLTVSGNSRITTHGFFDITTGNIDARGSGKIVGTGVVGWANFSTDGSGYIGCVNGTQWDNYTASPDPKPYPPANPLDLTTCGPGVLPVSLVSFFGEPTGNTVKLVWITSSEKNSDRFIIERSSDGKNFIPVGEVIGAGFSQQLLTYSFTDHEATGTGYYYRLQIVDMDESVMYSHVIHIKLKKERLLVFPNPGDGQSINIIFPTGSDKEVKITVSDPSGKTVYQTTSTITGGKVTADFSPKLAPGFYILVVKNGAEIAEEKLSIF